MGVIGVILLVFFVIVAALLVLMVLIQSEDGDSLGGLFAGGSSSAFGSRSGNVLTKTTSVLGALFLIGSFTLALLNRTPSGTTIRSSDIELQSADPNWLEKRMSQETELIESSALEDELPESNTADGQ